MTVEQAIQELIQSEPFKDAAKVKDAEGGRLRMFLTQYNRGEIKTGRAVELLQQFGYTIDVKKKKT